ncbi:3-hydroxyacyl-CoA dehydrogenase [Sphingomonas panacis]|nr:3-hydroxyacyl-CoA dehydrogenase [Sphingomonas panacis]
MINRILIAGAGLVGSEIGFYCATRGLDVVMYDISAQSLDTSRASHGTYADAFRAEGKLSEEEAALVLARLSYESDLSKAAADVDIVSESVTEALDIKKATYEALSTHCPPRTIFTTNTSTMLPSEIAKFTDRPGRLLACHVARPIWDHPILEIMPHAGTDPALVTDIVDFARRIQLVPILLKKEQPAYVSNSIMAAFITSALDLVSRGVASFEDVDRVWMIGTGAPLGPIASVDMMGIGTVYNALSHLAENEGRSELLPITEYLRTNFVDKGALGARSGQGFYTYPNPHFEQDDFFK